MHEHHNDSDREDALRDADIWAESAAEAAKRLDPPDGVRFLTEVIEVLTERRDKADKFTHGDDPGVASD